MRNYCLFCPWCAADAHQDFHMRISRMNRNRMAIPTSQSSHTIHSGHSGPVGTASTVETVGPVGPVGIVGTVETVGTVGPDGQGSCIKHASGWLEDTCIPSTSWIYAYVHVSG